MKSVKSFAAVLTALTTIAALGVGTITAGAAEIDEINRDIIADQANSDELFVASFDNFEDAQVANYLINNGASLAEAEELMAAYTSSYTTTNTTFNYPYYSLTKFSGGDHFMAVIDRNPSVAKDQNFDIYYQYANAESTGVEFDGRVYESSIYGHFHNYDYLPEYEDIANNELYQGIVTSFGTYAVTGHTDPALLMGFGFSLTNNSNVLSENEFHNLFATREYLLDGTNTTNLAFETVSVGDIDHNGEINGDDLTWLTRYLTSQSDLEFTFSDGLTHYTKATAELVADFNQDGVINTRDSIALNRYINNN